MSKKVLLVDDSESMRKIAGKAISDAGYDVVTAEDGKVGLVKMQQEKYDAIISDVNMPNMNGLEMVKAGKDHITNKYTPVIMLTTESSDEMRQKGKEAGAKVWMVKPFNPEQLLGVLRQLIGE
ncbi:MAG: response regulator [Candidatus Heimdallarchaeota archaeon]|nr:response regulator [Candidatus Heimdallarchaeota archaeon]